MGRFCVACSSSERKTPGTFSRHSFPKEHVDPVRREAWLNFVKQTRPNFRVVDSSHCICGQHFTEDCFAEHPGVMAVKEAAGFSRTFTHALKSDAVPTIISVESGAAVQKNHSHHETNARDKRVRIRNIRKELRELKKIMMAKAADKASNLVDNKEIETCGVQTEYDYKYDSADIIPEKSVDGMNTADISACNLKLECDSEPNSFETVDIKSDEMQIFTVSLNQDYIVDALAENKGTSFVDERKARSDNIIVIGKAVSDSGTTATYNRGIQQLPGKESVFVASGHPHNLHATHIFPSTFVPRSKPVPLSNPLPASSFLPTPIRPLLAMSPKTTSILPVRMFHPQQLLSRKPPCVDVSVWTEPSIKRHWGVQVSRDLGPHRRSKAIGVNMPCGCARRRVTAASVAVQCDIWSDQPSPSLIIKEESPDQDDVITPDKQMPNVYPARRRVFRKEKLQHSLCMKIEIPCHDFDECEEKKERSELGEGSSTDSASTMSPAHYVAEDNGCQESTLIGSFSDDCSEGKKQKLEEDNHTFALQRTEVTSVSHNAIDISIKRKLKISVEEGQEGHGSNTQPCTNIGDKGNHSTDSNGTLRQSCVLKEEASTAAGDRPYKCRFCAKVFSRLVTLKTHQYRCPQNRPYKCKECNKSFTHMSTLKMHQLIHT